jgi:predicted peptidase
MYKATIMAAVIAMFSSLVIHTSCTSSDNSDTTPRDTTTTGVGGGNPPGPATFVPQTTGISVKKMTTKDTGGISSRYVLYIPEGYNDKKDTKWPTILYLHGQGERGTDIDLVKATGLARKAANTKDFGFIVIAPQCNAGTWWDLPSVGRLYTEVLGTYNIDQSRIYLTGNSMGGYASWEWTILRQDRFAAVVPISAPLPGSWKNACVASKVPIWAFHNADDPQVGVADARFMRDTLTIKCNATQYKYTENATGGHDAWTKTYDDPALYTWMLQFKK